MARWAEAPLWSDKRVGISWDSVVCIAASTVHIMIGPRGLTGASSRLVRSRLVLLLRSAITFPLIVVVVAAGGIVLSVVFPGGLTRVLGARVRLRTFALFGRRRAHHWFDVSAEGQLLLLLHEGDAHRCGMRYRGLVVLLTESRRSHRVRRRVFRRSRRKWKQRMGMRVLCWWQRFVARGTILLEASSPRPAPQRLRLEPRMQRRMEVRPTHLPTATA